MDIKRIPIISMSTITSLTNVMGELPLPSADPDITSQSLGYSQDVYNEATAVLNQPNIHFFDSIKKALEATSTDEIKLKDGYEEEKLNVNNVPHIFRKIVQDNPNSFQQKIGFEDFFIKFDSKYSDSDNSKIKDKSDKSHKKKKKHKDEKTKHLKSAVNTTDAEAYTVAKRQNGLCLTLKKMKEIAIREETKTESTMTVVGVNSLANPSVISASVPHHDTNKTNVTFSDNNKTNSSSGFSANTSQSSLDLSKDGSKLVPALTSKNDKVKDEYSINLSEESSIITNINNDNNNNLNKIDVAAIKSSDSCLLTGKSEEMVISTESTVKDSIFGLDLNRSDSTTNSPSHIDDEDNPNDTQKFGLAAYLSKTTNNNSNSSSSQQQQQAANSTANNIAMNNIVAGVPSNENQPGSCISISQNNSVETSEIKTSDASIHESTPQQHTNEVYSAAETDCYYDKLGVMSSTRGYNNNNSNINNKTKGRNKELENLMKWQIKDKANPIMDPLDCTNVGPGERVKKRTRRCVSKRNEREDGSSISENSPYHPSPHNFHDQSHIILSRRSESSLDDDNRLGLTSPTMGNCQQLSQLPVQLSYKSGITPNEQSLHKSSLTSGYYSHEHQPMVTSMDTHDQDNISSSPLQQLQQQQQQQQQQPLLSSQPIVNNNSCHHTTTQDNNSKTPTDNNLYDNSSNIKKYSMFGRNKIKGKCIPDMSHPRNRLYSKSSMDSNDDDEDDDNNLNTISKTPVKDCHIVEGNSSLVKSHIVNDDDDDDDDTAIFFSQTASCNIDISNSSNTHNIPGHVDDEDEDEDDDNGIREEHGAIVGVGEEEYLGGIFHSQIDPEESHTAENMDLDNRDSQLDDDTIQQMTATNTNNSSRATKTNGACKIMSSGSSSNYTATTINAGSNLYKQTPHHHQNNNNNITSRNIQIGTSSTNFNKKNKPKKTKKVPGVIKNYNQSTDNRLQNLLASREQPVIVYKERIFRQSQINSCMDPTVLLQSTLYFYDNYDSSSNTSQRDSSDAESTSSSSASTIPFTIDVDNKNLQNPRDIELAYKSRQLSRKTDSIKQRFFHFLDRLLKNVEELDLLSIASRNKEVLSAHSSFQDLPRLNINQAGRLDARKLNKLNQFIGKMKLYNAMNEIPVGKLVRLLTLLLVNMNSCMKLNNDRQKKKRIQKLLQQQLVHCTSFSLIALCIMTVPDMPRAIILEDVIEHCTDLYRTLLKHLINPLTPIQNNTIGQDVLMSLVANIKTNMDYSSRLSQLVLCGTNCLCQLVLHKPNRLTDEAVIKLINLAITGLSSTTEIQMIMIPLLAELFSQYEAHRKPIVGELLTLLGNSTLSHNNQSSSNANNPSSTTGTASSNKKSAVRSYKINTEDEIDVLSATVMILFQSVVNKPPTTSKKSSTSIAINSASGGGGMASNFTAIQNSLTTTWHSALKIVQLFVLSFFKKVCIKSEDNYKACLDRFLLDLFTTFNKPEWPVSNILLHSFATTIIYHLNNNNSSSSSTTTSGSFNRSMAIDILGNITGFLARYCRSLGRSNTSMPSQYGKSHSIQQNEKPPMELLLNEINEEISQQIYQQQQDDKDEQQQLLRNQHQAMIQLSTIEQCLYYRLLMLQYLSMDHSDNTCSYAKRFCIGLFLNEINQSGSSTNSSIDHSSSSSCISTAINSLPSSTRDDFKLRLFAQLQPSNTTTNQSLSTDTSLSQTQLSFVNFNAIVIQSYLSYEIASSIMTIVNCQKDIDNFEIYLSKITKCLDENSVPVRTKSIRSLNSVLCEDVTLLAREEIKQAVHRRILDSSIAVREATIDLVGRFLNRRPELVTQYYPILIGRIADTGTSVRKRVIRVIWDICSSSSAGEFPHAADAYAKIMRRFYDEDSVKKLVNEVFKNQWFTPLSDREPVKLQQRIFNIADVIYSFSSDQKYNHNVVLQFITQLCKSEIEQNPDTKSQRNFEKSIQQIVECLVQTVLRLQEVSAAEVAKATSNSSCSSSQKRLCSTWNALHILCKVRPRLLWTQLAELSDLLRQVRSAPPHHSSLKQTLLINNEMAQCMNHLCGIIDCALAAAVSATSSSSSGVDTSEMMELVHMSNKQMEDVSNDLINLAINAPKRFIVDSAIKCLCRVTSFTKEYSSVQQNFYRYYSKVLQLTDQLKQIHFNNQQQQPHNSREMDSRSNLLFRMSFTSVVFWRYFDKKDLLGPELENRADLIFTNLLDITMLFAKNAAFRDRLVSNMNHLVHKDHQLLIQGAIYEFYIDTLHQVVLAKPSSAADYCKTAALVLENISNFFKHNELKAMEDNSNWKSKNHNESLKETNDVVSSFGNIVAQKYMQYVLDCCMVQKDEVRAPALNLICKILGQGLVQPMTAIAHLIALQGDPDPKIKFKADTQLNEINNKYKGYVLMKSIVGMRMSFQLHRTITLGKTGGGGGQLRGYVQSTAAPPWLSPQLSGGTAAAANCVVVSAVNHQLYTIIRKTKYDWRSFLDNVMALFENAAASRTYNNQTTMGSNIMPVPDISEHIFIADQLSCLPYQIIEEPVFIIYRIDTILSQHGQSLLHNITDQIISSASNIEGCNNNRSPLAKLLDQSHCSANDVQLIGRQLANDITLCNNIQSSMNNARGVVLLVALRDFLKISYNLNDSKLLSYIPGDASSHKVFDKPCSRTNSIFDLPEFCVRNMGNSGTLLQSNLVDQCRVLVEDYFMLRNCLNNLELTRSHQEDDNPPAVVVAAAINNSITYVNNNNTNDVPSIDQQSSLQQPSQQQQHPPPPSQHRSSGSTNKQQSTPNNKSNAVPVPHKRDHHHFAELSTNNRTNKSSAAHNTPLPKKRPSSGYKNNNKQPSQQRKGRSQHRRSRSISSNSSISTLSSARSSSPQPPPAPVVIPRHSPSPLKPPSAKKSNNHNTKLQQNKPQHTTPSQHQHTIHKSHKHNKSIIHNTPPPKLTLTELPSDFLGNNNNNSTTSSFIHKQNSTTKSFKPSTTTPLNKHPQNNKHHNHASSTAVVGSTAASDMNYALYPRKRLFKSSTKTMPDFAMTNFNNTKTTTNQLTSHNKSKSKKRKLMISTSSEEDTDNNINNYHHHHHKSQVNDRHNISYTNHRNQPSHSSSIR